MSLPAGSSAPKAIRFVIATGELNGSLVTAVRLRVRRPDGTLATWGPIAPTSATASIVTLLYILAGDGSSVPVRGKYAVGAWLYGAGDVLLDVSDVGAFSVDPPLPFSTP